MAVYNVTLYRQFDKRNNSTAHPSNPPSGISARPYECVGELVQGCDILAPIIAFNFDPEDMAIPGAPDSATIRVVQFNYAYIQDFRRCYFVKNWRHEYGRWIAEFSVDVLASFKNSLQLERGEQYVLRCTSDKNPKIADMLFPITSEIEILSENVNLSGGNFWNKGGNITNGFFVVGIINSDINTFGSVSYYVFEPSQLRELMNVLMGDFSWLDINDVSQELTQALFNPFQYIVSCMWFPTMPDCVTVTSVKYGWWNFDIGAYRITNAVRVNESAAYYKIPKHPDSDDDDSYLNMAPFRLVTGFFEPWGVFEIPVSAETRYIYASVSVDFITGNGILKIWRNASKSTGDVAETLEDVLIYKQAIVGVPIQLSQMATNVLNTGTTAIDSVGNVVDALFSGISKTMSIASSAGAAGANGAGAAGMAALSATFGGVATVGKTVQALAHGIQDIAEAGVPRLSTNGVNGSFLPYNITPRIIVRYRKQAGRNPELFGNPLCENRDISTLSGFIQCARPSLELKGATVSERDTFNAMLESGIYYE